MRRLALPLSLASSIAFFACGGGAPKPAGPAAEPVAPAGTPASASASASASIAGLGLGDHPNDSFGQGGLGMSGVGEGAGGQGDGIGLGSVGQLGRTGDTATSSGVVVTRPMRTIKMIEAGTDILGRLPPDVIKRIVRANYPRFRTCYEWGLKLDRTLHGIVAVDFAISPKGEVVNAHSTKGSMPSAKVVECVVSVFATLSFPEPEGGSVKVHYPIDFQSED